MKTKNIVSKDFYTLPCLQIIFFVVFVMFFALLKTTESIAEVLAPEGQAYCYLKQTDQLFYRHMIIEGPRNLVKYSFEAHVGDMPTASSCNPGPSGLIPSSYRGPATAIQYVNYICSDVTKTWIMWHGFIASYNVPPEEAVYMSALTSTEPPDDNICNCWFKYLSFEKKCKRWGSGEVAWNFETCSGICCPTGGCPGNDFDVDKNLGQPSKCE